MREIGIQETIEEKRDLLHITKTSILLQIKTGIDTCQEVETPDLVLMGKTDQVTAEIQDHSAETEKMIVYYLKEIGSFANGSRIIVRPANKSIKKYKN